MGKRTPLAAHPNFCLSRIVVPSENAIPMNDFSFYSLVYDTANVSTQSNMTATHMYLPSEQVIPDMRDLGFTDGEYISG